MPAHHRRHRALWGRRPKTSKGGNRDLGAQAGPRRATGSAMGMTSPMRAAVEGICGCPWRPRKRLCKLSGIPCRYGRPPWSYGTLPTAAPRPPFGGLWLHEIKHDGFRVIARKDSDRVRLYSRPGDDLTKRFPLIVESLARLRPRSCVIDGEAVACGDDGIASFDRIRYRRHDGGVFLYAFDLIELDGADLRRDPLAVRKATLASLLARAAPGLRFNEHLDEADGPLVFAHACKLGLEGIVSKRRDSPYSSGRSPHWIKSKNPNAPAVRREAEEEWGR
jgi:bifunctional non-homologous end joining protein LigD